MSWNPAAERLYGYAAAEVVGKPISVIIPMERSDELPELLARLRRGERIEHFETTRVRKGGREIDVAISLSPIKNATGGITGAATITYDIAERKRGERFQRDYLSLIAHDLRSPLTVMMGTAELLRRQLDKQGMTCEALLAKTIHTNGRGMNSMIGDLVTSARLEAGQVEMHLKPTDLRRLLSNIVERGCSPEDRARVTIRCPKSVPTVLADANHIERVIVNLLSNALKYSPPDTTVAISIAQQSRELLVSISDHGVGIQAEDLNHLFGRYYRARTGRQVEGLGLGLYIARLIMEAHGGRVWAESEFHKGSTFSFSLPVTG